MSTLTPADLWQFTGSETWYRHGLVKDVLFTDGIKYLAERAGAYWLIDEIALSQRSVKRLARKRFQVWELYVTHDHEGLLTCEDGDGHRLHTKRIPYTDFPLTEVTLYFTNSTILLPSEY